MGLDPYHAVVEATVQRARPVILTALAAVLAFIPLTHSVFWASMAYTLIGGTAIGTVLIRSSCPPLRHLVSGEAGGRQGEQSGGTDWQSCPGRAACFAATSRNPRAVDWLAPALQAAESAARLAPQAPR